MRRVLAIHAFAVALLAGGCRRGEIVNGVSDSAFVATMAELRAISRGSDTDSVSRARARQAVLQRRGLTAERLEQAARALADDPDRAAAIWQAIELRAAADTGAGAGTGAGAAPGRPGGLPVPTPRAPKRAPL